MKAAQAISETAEAWDRCPEPAAIGINRIALLRELADRLHASRSEALALGDRGLLGAVETLEARMEELRKLRTSDYPPNGSALKTFLSADKTLARPATDTQKARDLAAEIPEGLYAALGGREKLIRNDRLWEQALALHACELGWEFWSLEAEIPLEHVESWHGDLQTALKCRGIILFVESSGRAVAESRVWKGRWIAALKSARGHENSRAVPEAPAGAINAEWKLLFTPSRS